jgi:hypothetical protein
MDIHRLLEIGSLHMLDGTDLNDAGVVDQDVAAPALRDDLPRQRGDGGAIGHVADHRGGRETASRQILARRGELGFVARRQRHVGAKTPELARDGKAQPPRATGDQFRAAFEIHPAGTAPPQRKCRRAGD